MANYDSLARKNENSSSDDEELPVNYAEIARQTAETRAAEEAAAAEALAQTRRSFFELINTDIKEDDDDKKKEAEKKKQKEKEKKQALEESESSKTAARVERETTTTSETDDNQTETEPADEDQDIEEIDEEIEMPEAGTAKEGDATPVEDEPQFQLEDESQDFQYDHEPELVEISPEDTSEAIVTDIAEVEPETEVQDSPEEPSSEFSGELNIDHSREVERVAVVEDAAELAAEEAKQPEMHEPPTVPPPPPVPPTTFGGGRSGGAEPPNRSGGRYVPPNEIPSSWANYADEMAAYTEIDRQRGGPGAAIAFWAANFLSKRRDRTLDRRVDKLEESVDESLHETQLRRRQAVRLEQERKAAERAEELSRPVPLAEVIAASPLAGRRESEPEKSENKPKVRATEPRDRFEFTRDQQEAAHLEQSRVYPEKANVFVGNDPDALDEKTIERRHEAKDETRQFSSAALPQSETAQTFDGGERAEHSRYIPQPVSSMAAKARERASATLAEEEYKKSLRDGVLVGVAVSVLGFIAYFIFR